MQRRWTKNINGKQDLSYGERLKPLNVFSIKSRLLPSILIKYGKILYSDSVGLDLSVEDRTWGHSFKLVMALCITEVKRRFFNVRCIGMWTLFPIKVVHSISLLSFKSSLVQFLGDALFEY